MIPKVIHYCWFGKKEYPVEVKLCLSSWEKQLPDYDIKKWDETNSPMNFQWVKDAYFHRKYAFVADYVRLFALHSEGGIYLDTDMYIAKPLDVFLTNRFFLGFEDENQISMGIIGCYKGDEFIKECMMYYQNQKFNIVTPPLITHMVTRLLKTKYPHINGATDQKAGNIMIYKPDIFYPLHYKQPFEINKIENYLKPESYTIHLWNKSWMDEFHLFSKGNFKSGYKLAWERILRNPFLPIKYYKKLTKYLFLYLCKKA